MINHAYWCCGGVGRYASSRYRLSTSILQSTSQSSFSSTIAHPFSSIVSPFPIVLAWPHSRRICVISTSHSWVVLRCLCGPPPAHFLSKMHSSRSCLMCSASLRCLTSHLQPARIFFHITHVLSTRLHMFVISTGVSSATQHQLPVVRTPVIVGT